MFTYYYYYDYYYYYYAYCLWSICFAVMSLQGRSHFCYLRTVMTCASCASTLATTISLLTDRRASLPWTMTSPTDFSFGPTLPRNESACTITVLQFMVLLMLNVFRVKGVSANPPSPQKNWHSPLQQPCRVYFQNLYF